MNIDEIWQSFDPLYDDIATAETYPSKRPLLAHYTSINTLEAIMKNEELWLGNPLFMNDLEELRFGINEAAMSFRTHEGIRTACQTSERYERLQKTFEERLEKISNGEVFDTYVMCFSEHDRNNKNTDGLLSMWRGYGANGNGAAIVFDTQNITPVENSPLILDRVHYGSTETRYQWIDSKLDQFAMLFQKQAIPDDKFYLPVAKLLQRIFLFSLFTKHDGFKEEQEWRLAYVSERDRDEKLKSMMHYSIGPNGIQPKLKLKLAEIGGDVSEPISLEKIVHQIILGPSISSVLSVMTIKRMLETLNKKELMQKVMRSSTPYRGNY